MYVDDCNVILEADRSNIDRCHSVFQEFGVAFGLYYNWQDPKEVYIFYGPLPNDLESLGWSQGIDPNYLKLLGYFMGMGIFHEQMRKKISQKLEEGLRRSKAKFTSLAARIVLINNLILSTLWYYFTLWARDDKELEALEKIIIHFLWAEAMDTMRHRVKLNTITMPNLQGGLGVISLREQVRALISKIILWALAASNRPLLIILRGYIRQMSMKKWGCKDYSWVVVPCETLPTSQASHLLTNLCKFWNKSKKLIQHKERACMEEIKAWSLQVAGPAHIDKKVGCKFVSQKQLYVAGLRTIHDVSNQDGSLKLWKEEMGNEPSNNLRLPQIEQENAMAIRNIYIAEAIPSLGSLVWEFCMEEGQVQQTWQPGELTASTTRTFVLTNNSLHLTTPHPNPSQVVLNNIVTTQSKLVDPTMLRSFIGEYTFEAGVGASFCWRDKMDLHDATTTSIRKQLHLAPPSTHSNIQRWSNRANQPPTFHLSRNPSGSQSELRKRIYFFGRSSTRCLPPKRGGILVHLPTYRRLGALIVT